MMEWNLLTEECMLFNTQLDRKVLYPASQVYAAIVPKPIRIGIEKFL